MARLIISTLFVASFALSGAFAGLLPDILPGPIPLTKSAAKSSINRGAGIGKGTVNAEITYWVATVNSDPELTPECKACCAAKANEVRANILAEIDGVAANLIEKVDNSLSILLSTVWTDILGELFGGNGLIAEIITDLNTSLDGARQTCILQTANASTPVTA